MDLPIQYMQNMQKLLGDEYPEYAASFSCKSLHGLRVNNLKLETREIEKLLNAELNPIPFVKNGFYYDEDLRPAKSPYYNAGLFYLQEPSAMLSADRLPIEEGDFVLDLCAAPGGKSTAVLSKLNGTGFLLANDCSYSRAQALLKNLELFGGNNFCVCAEYPEKLSGIYKGFFDKILVDAPCSGEGMFRKDPSLIKDWINKGPEYYAPIQRDILDSAVSMLKYGGMLLYSTCTFSPLEDEENIKYILDKYPELTLVNIDKNYGIMPGILEMSEAARVYPHKAGGEGHFLCLIKKESVEETSCRRGACFSSDTDLKKCTELIDFFKLINKKSIKENICINKGNVYSLPLGYEALYDRSIRFLRTGLLIGEIDRNLRFKPHSALALSLKADDFSNVLNLSKDDVRTDKYLRGETIFVEDKDTGVKDGYVLICVDGFGLGFGKLSCNKLKNLLGKGYVKL